jgi:hypothetical protein
MLTTTDFLLLLGFISFIMFTFFGVPRIIKYIYVCGVNRGEIFVKLFGIFTIETFKAEDIISIRLHSEKPSNTENQAYHWAERGEMLFGEHVIFTQYKSPFGLRFLPKVLFLYRVYPKYPKEFVRNVLIEKYHA